MNNHGDVNPVRYYWVKFRFPEEVGGISWIVLAKHDNQWWSIGYGLEIEPWRVLQVGDEVKPNSSIVL
jgi:hypothetical protein